MHFKPPPVETEAERHARICRFADWLHSEYMQPYRKPTAEERHWIDFGGEPPVRVQALYDTRAARTDRAS